MCSKPRKRLYVYAICVLLRLCVSRERVCSAHNHTLKCTYYRCTPDTSCTLRLFSRSQGGVVPHAYVCVCQAKLSAFRYEQVQTGCAESGCCCWRGCKLLLACDGHEGACENLHFSQVPTANRRLCCYIARLNGSISIIDVTTALCEFQTMDT